MSESTTASANQQNEPKGPADELTVYLPPQPPAITPAVARVLWKILRAEAQRRRLLAATRHLPDEPITADDQST